ncbi:tyrosine-type recombinase/integrase [Pseudoxanthomonas wuyuanensis]|uniref:Site-specific recombinase XerD n=1 Tax=Pseudoxanthomonas wuyuanensis TaxID=1073196 RepID=A0A286D9G9_9GAMM|nr:tyrosine-type recombinase/integrase [Pseudoxanthomonas wuyuanensis]KAF1721967.1 hypothetical protein CSC75_04400 [Pseudoxanthomonas wuyuanensis]SOD55306.1 Site-specific recombinase XerD [Pseudoxanthomonas wuyuanensis]
MPRIKVTTKGLEAIVSKRHAERVDYFDSATPGLSLRVGPRDAVWHYMRRIDGKLTRLRLGTDDELAAVGRPDRKASFTIAREKVGEIEQTIAAGKHPKAEQARERAEKRESRERDEGRLVRNVAEAWKKSHLGELAATTQADYKRALAEFTEAHGDDDIGVLTRGQIKRALDRVKARSPSAANRAAVVIRLLFAYATDRYDLPSNPAADIKNPARQKIRKRTLSRDEVRILWKACLLAGYPYGDALRFALCTGQRIGEVGNFRRSDIDSSGEYWEQTENKSDSRIDVHVAEHARGILAACPDFGRRSPFFTAGRASDDEDDLDGRKMAGIHSDRWNKAIPRHIQPRISEAAKALGLDPITEPWTPHDLRRTVRTGLTGWCLGVSPDTAERVLNHSIGGLRAVYDHADYRPHVAEALRIWDAELALILDGKPSSRQQRADATKKVKRSAKVVPIRRRA